MSQYMFGVGNGWLGKKAAAIARKHNCELVNYTDPECKCGRGCSLFDCKESRRHWFESENRGDYFNTRIERSVMAEFEAA